MAERTWCTGPARIQPGEVREQLDGLAYTTVVTILSRLHAKGVLDRHKAGRAFRYAPVADEPGLTGRRPSCWRGAREACIMRCQTSDC